MNGYTLRCPNCGSKNSYYSVQYMNWICDDCGLSDAPIEAWRGSTYGVDKQSSDKRRDLEQDEE